MTIVVSWLVALWLQQAPSAVISGVVMTGDAAYRAPVRGAIVSLIGTGIPNARSVSTDGAGRFVFTNVPGGRFRVTVSKPGYLQGVAGSREPGRAPGLPVVLADAQQRTDLVVELPRGAAIEGTVRDDHGVPLGGFDVSAMTRRVVYGDVELEVASTNWTTTDDRGHYRIYGLPPGDYIVRVRPDVGSDSMDVLSDDRAEPVAMARAVVFAPNEIDCRLAEVITLATGEERSGVDVVSRMVPAVSVELLLEDPSGRTIQNTSIGVVSVDRQALAAGSRPLLIGADGRLRLPTLVPGRFRLYSQAVAEADGTSVPVYLNAELILDGTPRPTATARFSRGQQVRGVIRGPETAAPPETTKIRLEPIGIVKSTAGGPYETTGAADGRFVFAHMPPGRYKMTIGRTDEVVLGGISVGGSPVDDGQLELRAGADLDVDATLVRGASVTGTVVDALGRPAEEYSVVMIDQRTGRAPRVVPTTPAAVSRAGMYAVSALAAGDYRLVVIANVDRDSLADDRFVDSLVADSILIRIVEGQHITRNLTLSGAYTHQGSTRR